MKPYSIVPVSLRFLEHGEHAPCHEEAAEDVDPGHEDRNRRQQDHQETAGADLHQRAEDDDRRDRVRHRHERGVKRVGDVPDHLEANEDSQHEDDEMLHEARRGHEADTEHQHRADGQERHLLARLRLEGGQFLGLLLLGRQLRHRGLRLGRNRLDLGRWWREGDRALMGDRGTPDDIVFHVVIDRAVLLGRQVGHHVADIGGIERRALGRHPRGEVGIADNCHAVFGDDLLVLDRQLAIAAALGGEVDNDRARLHHLDHILGPEHRRIPVRDQRGGDDDVDLGRHLAELGKLPSGPIRSSARDSTGGSVCANAVDRHSGLPPVAEHLFIPGEESVTPVLDAVEQGIGAGCRLTHLSEKISQFVNEFGVQALADKTDLSFERSLFHAARGFDFGDEFRGQRQTIQLRIRHRHQVTNEFLHALQFTLYACLAEDFLVVQGDLFSGTGVAGRQVLPGRRAFVPWS